MRLVIAGAGALVALMLGLVQLASMSLYGDLAAPPAVPAVLSPQIGIVLGGPLASARLPALLRVVYAQALLHRAHRAAAAAIVAGLPDRADTADLRGQIAEGDGALSQALSAYARAGDFERAQRLIDAGADAGHYEAAAALERSLANALRGPGQAVVRARALWRLGQLAQYQAVAVIDAGRRITLERDALESYEQALAIAPNEETYLLAAGQQSLTLGDRAAAGRYYLRALDAVPDSADARAGLIRART